MKDLTHPDLAPSLLEALAPFRMKAACGMEPHGPGLFSYCALTRERLASVRLPQPVLGVVLSGRKEIWQGMHQQFLKPGDLFALPGQVDLDIVNDPDPRSGIYQSLVMEVSQDAVINLPQTKVRSDTIGAAIPVRPELIDAVAHAAMAVHRGLSEATIRRARISELLALLMEEPAAAVLFDLTVVGRISQLIRLRPDEAWTSEGVARALGMSESTLRRRLRAAGSSFTAILRRERMALARQMLEQGVASGLVALAVGYASRSHFARACRDELGRNPRHLHQGKDLSTAEYGAARTRQTEVK